MTTIIARASEAVHWYRRDGAPQYTVKARDGSNRPTTLRDAKKLDLVPSVTTILKIMAKPGLEAWKLEQMLLSALTLPRGPGEDEKAYIARIVADSKESGKQAAEAGTRIHESIEKWGSGDRNVEHKTESESFFSEVNRHFGLAPDHQWIPEQSFASPLGYGGKVDLFSEGIVVDTKTKDFGPYDKVDGYDEHVMQLSSYRHGLEMPQARCANVFVSRTHPGLIRIIEWPQEELERGWEMFQCLLQFWKVKHMERK